MKYFLKTEELEIAVQSKGAELTSIINRKNNLEYIWQADPAYWNRHAPVLFPIVGRLKNDKYFYEGEEYEMSQHGFARDLEFTVTQHDTNALRFLLESSAAKTIKKYPFKFKLEILYTLNASSISVRYNVENTDTKDIYFSIGAHPAFNCPLEEGQKFEDYVLHFREIKDSNRHLLANGLFTGQQEAIPLEDNQLPLSYSLFEKDAIVLKNSDAHLVTLKSRNSDHGVTVSFPDFPYLGIWTKQKGAPFLCIEPWCGLADNEKASGNLKEKEGINNLSPGKAFSREYIIDIF